MFKPFFNNVLVKIDEEKEDLTSFYMPDEVSDENTKTGVVISVGPGNVNDKGELKECVVKEGDKVLLLKMVGNKVKLDGEEYTIIRDTDVLGIMED